MKKKITKKVFFDFLRRNHCLKEYFAACKKALTTYNIKNKSNYPLRFFLHVSGVVSNDNIFNSESLNHSFFWDLYPLMRANTSWRLLHEQWCQFLYNNNFDLN